MHVNQLKESKFLKKEDVGTGLLVTIEGLSQENVSKEGAPEEMKYALHFKETEKPLILNSTNGQLIAQITGEEDTDHWAGHKIVLYNDPTISFGGKIVGGIRCRAPKQGSGKPSQASKRPAHDDDDSIPF